MRLSVLRLCALEEQGRGQDTREQQPPVTADLYEQLLALAHELHHRHAAAAAPLDRLLRRIRGARAARVAVVRCSARVAGRVTPPAIALWHQQMLLVHLSHCL